MSENNYSKAGSRKLPQRKIIIMALAVTLIIAISLTGVSLARYIVSERNGESGNVADFDPVIVLGEEWERDITYTSVGVDNATRLTGTLDNRGSTDVVAIIMIEGEGVLPLDYVLYAAEDSQLESSEPLVPVLKEENKVIYEISVSALSEQAFTLSVEWRQDSYDERFNGIQEKVHITVVCEQI